MASKGNVQNCIRGFSLVDENGKHYVASKAGKAGAEAKRKAKTLREELLLLLDEKDTREKISVALITKALGGDLQAFITIRDTIGEKPIDKIESKTEQTVVNINIADDDKS